MPSASSSHQKFVPPQRKDQTVKVALANVGSLQKYNYTSIHGEKKFNKSINESISHCMEGEEAKFMVLNELHPNRHKLLKLPKNVKLTCPDLEKVEHEYTRALAILHDDAEWEVMGGIIVKLFPGMYLGDGVDWNKRKTWWREGFICKYKPRRAPTPSNPAHKPLVLVTAHMQSSDDHDDEIDKRHPKGHRKQHFIADALHAMLHIALGSEVKETLSKSQVIVLGDFNIEGELIQKVLAKLSGLLRAKKLVLPSEKLRTYSAGHLHYISTGRVEGFETRLRGVDNMHGVLVAEVTEFGGASTPSTEASLLGGPSRNYRGSSLGATHPRKQSSSGDIAAKVALEKPYKLIRIGIFIVHLLFVHASCATSSSDWIEPRRGFVSLLLKLVRVCSRVQHNIC